MINDLDKLKRRILFEKQRLLALYKAKGQIDSEVLQQSKTVDRLINRYNEINKLCTRN
jgi:hypothetical protein